MTLVAQATYSDVSTASALSDDIKVIDLASLAGPGTGTAYTITLAAGTTLAEAADIKAVNLNGSDTLTIDGQGAALDGGGAHRGLFVYSGDVTIENLTIQNAVASGGNGADGGSGGAGLGGGLFVAGPNLTNGNYSPKTAGGNVTLGNVSFKNDSAVGGGGSVSSNTYGGGGGGLGGDGAFGQRGGGGGGGVGVGANGGLGGPPGNTGGPGGAGGEGLIPGAAGGANGGGGAAAGMGGMSGGGGGGGGTGYAFAGLGGHGGVGNGFGGGGTVFTGGFGGGSGSSNGGFGGGGGGRSGNAGFGGGAAGVANGVTGGGGGLGAGGDIFVQQGASLNISGGSSLAAGTVTAGTGTVAGSNGQAYGNGIFIHSMTAETGSVQTVTLGDGQSTGQFTEIDGVIADTTSSVGYGGDGAGSVIIAGAGTVVLAPKDASGAATANTYAGGTALNGGTLELAQNDSAGTGAITFGTAPATLRLDAAPPSGAFGDTLTSVAVGDTLDLRGLGFVAGATATVSGSTLTVTSASTSENFTLSNPLTTTFSATSDNAGGTLVFAGTVPTNAAPTIAGTMANQATTSEASLKPFSGVTVGDANSGAIDTVTITLSGSGGTLAGSGLTTNQDGTYTIAATDPATLTTELAGLTFTPRAGQPGTSGTTGFTLADTSSAGSSASDSATTVTDTDPSVAPTPTPTPTPVPPTPVQATDAITVDSTVAYDGRGSFTITGQASSTAGVTGVEFSATIDGQTQDLGPATLNGDGSFSFTDQVGAATQSFITAVETDGVGNQSSQDTHFDLTAGVKGMPFKAYQDSYDPTTNDFLGQTLFKRDGEVLYTDQYAANPDGTSSYTFSDGIFFDGKRYSSFVDNYTADGTLSNEVKNNNDGSHSIEVDSPGQSVASDASDTFHTNGQGDTTFVFTPGFGHDVVRDFQAKGARHDTLDLPSSDFTNLADVLRNTHSTPGGAVITDPTSGDVITIAGVSKAELTHNKRDFSFHG